MTAFDIAFFFFRRCRNHRPPGDYDRHMIGSGISMSPDSDSIIVPLTGACQCEQVRFRMEAAPIITHCCRCRDCQKASGSVFRINAIAFCFNALFNPKSALNDALPRLQHRG